MDATTLKHEEKYLAEIKKLLFEKYSYIVDEADYHSIDIQSIAEQVCHYHEDIIGSMPGNVYWFDKNLIAVGCNKNVLDMMGMTSIEEFRGLPFEKLGEVGGWTSLATQMFKQDTSHVLKNGQAKLNIEEPPIPSSDGSMLYFLTSRVPIFDKKHKNILGVVGISIDITARKKMEAALLCEKEKAEAAHRAKIKFMENMSHDFKTPLNGVYGVIQILRARQDLPDDLHPLILAQEKSILRLKNLIDVILDFDRIESGLLAMKVKPLDLMEIIEGIAQNLSLQVSEKNIRLFIHYADSVPRNFISDPHFITSILLNLMSNAVKFTDKGQVDVRVVLVEEQAENVILSIAIEDTGIGMDPDKIPDMFERFQREENTNTNLRAGHGLGLSIVKELLHQLQGNIEATSKKNQGSCFKVTLPLKKV